MIAQIVPIRRMPLHLPWLDYKIPEVLESKIKVGQLVKIPFRSSSTYGIVHHLTPDHRGNFKTLKSVEEIVNPSPALNPAQLTFLEEISILYQTSLGFLLKCNLFSLQKSKIKQFSALSSQHNPAISSLSKPTVFTHATFDERIEYLEQNIDSTAQNLILVPEITDITALVSSFSNSIKEKISIITSDLSPKEMDAGWFQIWSGEKTIIIGTRTALFLPHFNLKNIFLLDEAHPSHKSWDMAPRFHARDATLILSTSHKAHLHFIHHTPSTETFYFSEKKVFTSTSSLSALKTDQTTLVHLTKRNFSSSVLSEEILQKIDQIPEGIIFLFMHQRGSAHYIICKDCNTVFNCPKCHGTFTYHARKNILICHACKFTIEPFTTCASCSGNAIAMLGTGTEAMEQEIKKFFTEKNVVRVDSDEPHPSPLLCGGEGIRYHVPSPFKERARVRSTTIVIGTQFAWNKLDWKKIRMMVFVDSDIPLSIPEYKTNEYLWYSIRDAQFRLPQEAELYIQTTKPEQYIFSSLPQPGEFYRLELIERKKFSYPPFAYLVKLFTGNTHQLAGEAEARRLYNQLQELTKTSQNITISPPLPLKPYCVKKKYWQAVIIKVSYGSYKQDIKKILAQIPEEWKVDLNPNSLLGF